MKNLQRRDEHISLILITLVLMLGVTAAFNAFAHNPVPVPAPPPPIVVPPAPGTDSGGAENTNLRAFAISGALICLVPSLYHLIDAGEWRWCWQSMDKPSETDALNPLMMTPANVSDTPISVKVWE
jgi:hypothetical protein